MPSTADGTYIVQRGNVIGLTTAAGIWAAAAVGMGFGFGLNILSAGGIAILLVVLRIMGHIAVDHSSDRRARHGGQGDDPQEPG